MATATADISSATPDDDDIDFIVQYGRVNNMTMYETVAKLENVSIDYDLNIYPYGILYNASITFICGPSSEHDMLVCLSIATWLVVWESMRRMRRTGRVFEKSYIVIFYHHKVQLFTHYYPLI